MWWYACRLVNLHAILTEPINYAKHDNKINILNEFYFIWCNSFQYWTNLIGKNETQTLMESMILVGLTKFLCHFLSNNEREYNSQFPNY